VSMSVSPPCVRNLRRPSLECLAYLTRCLRCSMRRGLGLFLYRESTVESVHNGDHGVYRAVH
jgi:hypothetical protein